LDPVRKKNWIAILGTAGCLQDAPVTDDRWEIWGITQIYKMHQKLAQLGTSADYRTRWFEIHGRSKWLHDGLQDYYKWLAHAAKNRFPVYIKEANEKVPDGTIYPREEILEFLQPYPYITCTCSWMIALATLELTEEVELANGRKVRVAVEDAKIGIWGIDMMVADATFGQEYSYQRPSVEYHLGIAKGYGIEVVIPDECDIVKCAYWYGDKDDNPWRNRLVARRDQLSAIEKNIKQQMTGVQMKAQQVKGAREVLEWITRAHMPGDEGDAGGISPDQFSNKVAPPKVEKMPGTKSDTGQVGRTIQVSDEQMDAIIKQLGQTKTE
jgi:hypothetical protein